MKQKSLYLRLVKSKFTPIVLLVITILIAAFFRFYQLNHLPPGLHPSEAANGLDVFRIIDHHDLRVLYNTSGPREALFFYFQAIFVLLLGNTILALRIAPALFGVAAVVVIYFWAKDWFGRRVGLLAAFVAAISPWLVTISRDGFRASLVPLVVALVAFLGGRAINSGKRIYFILAGLVFGLGLYTYTAFVALAAAVVLTLVFLLIKRRDWAKRHQTNLIVGFVVAAVVAVPLIIFSIGHLSQVGQLVSRSSFLTKDLNGGRPLPTLIDSSTKTLLQFNFRGDENYRQNLAGVPLLDIFIGLMFVLGILLSFRRIKRPKYFALMAIFAVMLLPAAASAGDLPSSLRSIGAAPATFIFAALGINYLLARWYLIFPINGLARTTGLGVIILLLALSMIRSYKQYFVAWAQDPKTYVAYSEDMVAMARYLNKAGSGQTDFVASDDYSIKTVEYLTHHKTNFTHLSFDELKNLPITGGKKLFLVQASSDNATDTAEIEIIKAKFPNGRLHLEFSTFNNERLFYVYEVGS